MYDQPPQDLDELGLIQPRHRLKQVEGEPLARHRGRLQHRQLIGSSASRWRRTASLRFQGSGTSGSSSGGNSPAAVTNSSRKNGLPPVRWWSSVTTRIGIGLR